MTDLDVMTRVGVDLERAVVAIAPRRDGYRPAYAVTVKGIDAARWMALLRSELGAARQKQIDRALLRATTRGKPTTFAPQPVDEATVVADPGPHDCGADEQLAWLAGLLEGEGCFTTSRSGAHTYPVIVLKMVSRDVVERAARLLATTNVHLAPPRDASWRPTVRAAVSGAAAAAWMQRLRPLMGGRRGAAIDHALDAYYPIRLTQVEQVCCVPDCTEPPRGRGLCHKHYMSWLRDRSRGRTPRVRPLRSN